MDVKESCGVGPDKILGGGGDGYAKILSAFEKISDGGYAELCYGHEKSWGGGGWAW